MTARIFGLTLLLAAACGGSAKEPADQKTDNDTGPAETTADNADETECIGDSDCVPNACCHPKACVPKSQAPTDCGDVMCTAECAEGSMDCGKGSCACEEGVCVVDWKE